MRLWIMLLAGAAGLAAQNTETPLGTEASQKLAEQTRIKVQEFEQKLKTALRPRAGTVEVTLPKGVDALHGQGIEPAARVCSIPLLMVGRDASFKSKMPVIAPDAKTFAAREIVPPAPVCDGQMRK